MRALIKSISLENFKGVKSATYTFDGKNATITGCNGAGKTTIADSYFWLLADKSYGLASNPNIRPIGTQECTPRVDIVFDIDGKEVTVAKIQKCTVKKSKTGGADTISISNSYEVNGVECGERDFKKKMQSYGFDFDLFLPLSHLDVFTGQKSADMQKVLFGMASEKTDKEIADMTEGAEIVANLLSDYSAEEIQAMQNATLRKIREVYGKSGEILRAKIEGLELSKIEIDAAELELQKSTLDKQIVENRAKQEDISRQFEEQEKTEKEIYQLKREINCLQQKADETNQKKRDEIRNKLHSLEFKKEEIQRKIKRNNAEICEIQEYIEENKKRMNEYAEKWISLSEQIKEEESRDFEEEASICPYCKQKLPDADNEKKKADFKNAKEENIEDLKNKQEIANARGFSCKEQIKEQEKGLTGVRETLKENQEEEIAIDEKLKEARKSLEEFPESVDISDREDVKEIQKQIAEKEAALHQDSSAEETRRQLRAEGDSLQKQMDAVNEQFALVKKNKETDKQIVGLRKQQREFEQQKADAERVIDQLDMVSKKKNEMLTEEINKNFDIVRWQLFEFQKNGEYKSCCIPLVDGKRFGESTNTGREILAKLDIIKGLQRFYGQSYPVFLDGAECLSEETKNRIDMGCQIIHLEVPQLPMKQRMQMTAEQIKEFEEYYKDLRIEVMQK